MIGSIGIIGYGSFGVFLNELISRFLPQSSISIFSPDKEPDGRLFRSLETTLKCDVLFLAVPIAAYESVLHQLQPDLGPETIIVDIATVKVHTANLIRKIVPSSPFLSIHPMFGPASYAKKGGDVSGLRIALTDTNLDPGKLKYLKEWVSELGFSVIELSGQAHDKKLAETLFLTHYVGRILALGNFERTDIDTASFGYLMDAVDSVRDDADLFSDVNQFNPHCKDVVEQFDRCERAVKDQYLGEAAK